jgi:HEAT repeat protein
VGIAEVSATAALSGGELSRWVIELGGSEGVAAEAQAALVALGEAALPVLGERFTGLGLQAQTRALDVLDSHPCGSVVDLYLLAIPGALEERALRTLRACGGAGLPTLAAAARSNVEIAVAVAPLLIQQEPGQAVLALAPHLGSPRREVRAALRGAIAQAVGTGKADAALTEMLSANLPRRAAIDLLRAAAGSLRRVQVAATAEVLRVMGGEPSFSSRYLLLGPAVELVDVHPEIEQFVLKTLASDPQFGARARAAELVPAIGGGLVALIKAVADEQVRVRVAAVQSLGRSVVATAEPALIQRVLSDKWPLVRAEAVRALAGFPRSQSIDEALATSAAEDASPHVRRPSLVALGRRRATGQVQVVRESLERDEDVFVRAAAAESLGALCDYGSLDVLTRYAAAAASLTATPAERTVGRSSLNALGRLNPPDLEQRLAPFSAKEVPRVAKSLARIARKHSSPCRRNPGL